MLFRVQYIVRDLEIPEGESLEFMEESPHRATLVVRRPTRDENSGLALHQCLGTLNTEEPITAKIRPRFEIQDTPHPAVKDIGARVDKRLTDFLVRAACIIRWRRGLTGHPNPIAGMKRPLEWSDDGHAWQAVPGAFRLMIDTGIPHKRLSADICSSITDLVRAGNREPLGHELFQEAWKQRNELPRSSLTIGMTAAEVGFKMFVADLVPNVGWLAMHAPTPPLIQMLTEYLPRLPIRQHIKDFTPLIPRAIIDLLKKGVKLRNETIHAGNPVPRDTLKEILLAVRDLLYLLDLYAGYSWALEAVSHESMTVIRAEVEEKKSDQNE
jgi:hypothetical protein